MQKDMPLISIIVPVYNTLEYLPKCVSSLTTQTYTNLEILLVDDGSTDGSGKWCDEQAKKDTRIRVLHKENGGSSSARNLGISQARGEYLGFIDSDDYASCDMYECLYRGIQQYQVQMAQVGRDEIDIQGNLLPNICEPPEVAECLSAEEFLRELLMHRGDSSLCSKLIHRDCFRNNRFPLGKLNEDFYLLIHMLAETKGLVSMPGQLYHVVYRLGSNSRKVDKEDFSRVYSDCVDNADVAAQIVKKEYPALRPVALRFGVFQRLEYLLHIPISQMNKENVQYRAIVKWIRNHWLQGMRNPHLTLKNKCYQTLFAISPKGIRILHRKLKSKNSQAGI